MSSNARDIIIRPIITEKTMRLMDADNKITFEVKKGTNKTQVKEAVKEIFNVSVEKVNIMNCRPKDKRVGKYAGKTNAVRKAIVKLPAGQDIDLFNDK
jgi:large subunit ribosomal protein L23